MVDYIQFLNEDTDISIINEVIPNYSLTLEQLDVVKKSVLNGSGIWTVETGLGKTIISLGILNLLAPKLQGKITVVTAPSITVKNFYDYIRDNTPLRPVFSTGGEKDVTKAIEAIESGEADCIVCQDSIWRYSIDFVIYLYNNLERVSCLIYDECSCTEDNDGVNNLIQLARYIPYVYPANATPMKSNLYTMYALLYMTKGTDDTFRQFRRKYSHNVQVGEGVINQKDSLKIAQDFKKYIINLNRADVGAKTTYKEFRFEHCIPTEKQMQLLDQGYSRNEVLYTLPSAKIAPVMLESFNVLIRNILLAPPTENKLIYCRTQDASKMLYKVLKTMGLKVFAINGFLTSKPEEKQYTEEEFNTTEGAIMITSIDVGSNLNTVKYIYVYETPSDIIQYIARAARGFNEKELNVVWIYYPDYEVNTIFNAATKCLDNADLLERDKTLYHILRDEFLRMYPDDPRAPLLIA